MIIYVVYKIEHKPNHASLCFVEVLCSIPALVLGEVASRNVTA
jgi:hypothetical protein